MIRKSGKIEKLLTSGKIFHIVNIYGHCIPLKIYIILY